MHTHLPNRGVGCDASVQRMVDAVLHQGSVQHLECRALRECLRCVAAMRGSQLARIPCAAPAGPALFIEIASSLEP